MNAIRTGRRPAATLVPMSGTGDGPRPDQTTFTRRAIDRSDDDTIAE
ncbi:hypothetical protein [Halorubrum trueperi]|uniref:Uncharacterized protein n=1 Tax=Halorubrum trueperi TaxID=2004704 RepID=A0ABD5ULZ0_9EURY